MSTLLVPNVGELYLIDQLLKDSSGADFTLGLYKTNITPAESDTLSTYTAGESDFTGYSRKTLARGDWGAAATVSNKAESEHEEQSWVSSSSGQSVYGYFVFTGSTLLWAEKLDSAIPIDLGYVVNVTPKFNGD